jgi:predicted RNA-binding protein
MCEANAYLSKDGKEELIMENVDVLELEEDGLFMQDIFGQQRRIRGRIREMKLVEHRIVIAED